MINIPDLQHSHQIDTTASTSKLLNYLNAF